MIIALSLIAAGVLFGFIVAIVRHRSWRKHPHGKYEIARLLNDIKEKEWRQSEFGE